MKKAICSILALIGATFVANPVLAGEKDTTPIAKVTHSLREKKGFDAHLRSISLLMAASYDDVMTTHRAPAAAITERDEKHEKEAAGRAYRRKVEMQREIGSYASRK